MATTGRDHVSSAASASAAAPDDDDDDELWTTPPFSPSDPLQTDLKDFESMLRCGICRHFLNIAVSIQGCQHSFCSECIRRAIQASIAKGMRSPKCPACNVTLDKNPQKVLKPNRSLQMLVKSFQELRDPLRRRLVLGSSGVLDSPQDDESSHGTEEYEGNDKRQSSRKRPARRANTPEEDDSSDESTDPSPKEKTSAPQAATTSAFSTVDRLPWTPKPYYETLKKGKKNKIVDLCQQDGLATEGSTEQLIKRHEEFMLLYHAECDSFLPQRSREQISREVSRRESRRKLEQKAALMTGNHKHAALAKQICDKAHKEEIGDSDSGAGAPASSGDTSFNAAWDEGFAILINDLRKRMPQKRRKWTAEDLDRSIDEIMPGLVSQKPSARLLAPSGQTSLTTSAFTPTLMGAAQVATAGQTSFSLQNPYKPSSDTTSVSISQPSTVSIGSISSPSVSVAETTAIQAFGQRTLQHTSGSATRNNPYAQASRRKRKASTPSITGPWTCVRCTFQNAERTWAHARCVMCNVPRESLAEAAGRGASQEVTSKTTTTEDSAATICIDC